MTKKRNPLENPPAASSSDDDEVQSSAGEEEEFNDSSSSSSEEDQPKAPPSSSAVTIAIPGRTTLASDSESGSETESDTEQRSGKSIPAAKSSNKGKSSPPGTNSGTKRPSEGTSKETNSKRAKKKIGGGEDSKKPGAFQRLWTEEDEIAVLQGMIDFKKDTGNSPYDDTNAYYDYIKKSISFEVSKNQFMDKLRGLKKKYINGKDKPSFTKSHDLKSYRLCKYIWGPDGMGLESAVKSNGVSKKKTKKLDSVKQELSLVDDGGRKVLVHGGDERYDWFENSFLVRGIVGFGVDEHYVKQGWSLVPVETKKKVEDKVKTLQAKEIEFVLHKTEILHEVTSMIAEASKNNPLE